MPRKMQIFEKHWISSKLKKFKTKILFHFICIQFSSFQSSIKMSCFNAQQKWHIEHTKHNFDRWHPVKAYIHNNFFCVFIRRQFLWTMNIQFTYPIIFGLTILLSDSESKVCVNLYYSIRKNCKLVFRNVKNFAGKQNKESNQI